MEQCCQLEKLSNPQFNREASNNAIDRPLRFALIVMNGISSQPHIILFSLRAKNILGIHFFSIQIELRWGKKKEGQ